MTLSQTPATAISELLKHQDLLVFFQKSIGHIIDEITLSLEDNNYSKAFSCIEELLAYGLKSEVLLFMTAIEYRLADSNREVDKALYRLICKTNGLPIYQKLTFRKSAAFIETPMYVNEFTFCHLNNSSKAVINVEFCPYSEKDGESVEYAHCTIWVKDFLDFASNQGYLENVVDSVNHEGIHIQKNYTIFERNFLQSADLKPIIESYITKNNDYLIQTKQTAIDGK